MRRLLTTLLIVVCLTSYGQEGRWKPFKLLVVQPDTAIIHKSFHNDIDSIVVAQLRRYYKSVDIMDKLANCIGCPRDSGETENMKAELARLKSYEGEARKFRFFHLLSSYSTEVYNFYFNEYEPYSTIVQIPNQQTDLASLKLLADSSKADYIVFYSDVHTSDTNRLLVLKLTTSLYALKEDAIILNKETLGDIDSRGDMWTCNMEVPLSCLFINAVRTSTDEVANVLRKRQINRK